MSDSISLFFSFIIIADDAHVLHFYKKNIYFSASCFFD
jgi:hypothetical protein